jgi:hypothetical protein
MRQPSYEARPPRIAEGSWLHRRLSMIPGHVPKWLCGNSCEGVDVFFLLVIISILAGLLGSALLHPSVFFLTVALNCLFVCFIYLPFQYREHWGRARRRRDECVWCGQPGTASDCVCATCGRVS